MSLDTIPFERWSISEQLASCMARPPDLRGSHQFVDFDSATRHDVRRHESLMQMVHLPYQQALSHAFQAISKTIKTTILLEQSKLESKEELLALKSLYTDTQTTARQPSIQRIPREDRRMEFGNGRLEIGSIHGTIYIHEG
ncbi:hypothetical protein BofuT4_P024360.1 [Botrytis cinerea T4]|uniref:Uncharacterized protein n=1 Tax=Botryotinia fuckeliana (strain T4) TaxID=999810 RepID=G2YFS9_BOTF4|nr:hypothetical protein BofuT4_P024360.1 [Botrytis cinerea T4]